MHVLGEQSGADVIITEIGGTTGDIEGLPFLEAIREFALEVGYNNAIFVHVTFVPFIKAAGELKSKPTQQSVAKLREIGIAPHIVVCRCEKPLNKEVRQKISMFCNVPFEAVVEEKDVDHTIYEVPLMLQRERVDDLVCNLLHLDTPPAKMAHWQEIIRKIIAPQHRVRIAVVGKYIELQDAYKSVYEAISHGGIANDCGVEIQRVDSEDIERDGAEKYLKGLGGAGHRGQNSGGTLRPREPGALPRPVPRHANRDDRVRAKRLEAGEGAFDGGRSEHAPPGHRHARRSEHSGQERRHDAARGPAVPISGWDQNRAA